MHRIKLAVLSSLILVAVVACGSEMSSEMPAETRCITALVYLVQDHAHPVTVSGGYGDADKAVIGDEARVDEIISTHCATFIDTRLLSELRAWPKENLIQSGPRKGNRRQ